MHGVVRCTPKVSSVEDRMELILCAIGAMYRGLEQEHACPWAMIRTQCCDTNSLEPKRLIQRNYRDEALGDGLLFYDQLCCDWSAVYSASIPGFLEADGVVCVGMCEKVVAAFGRRKLESIDDEVGARDPFHMLQLGSHRIALTGHQQAAIRWAI